MTKDFGAPFSHVSLEANEWYVHIVTGDPIQPIISGVGLKIAVDKLGSKKLVNALITNGETTYDVSEFNGLGCY